MPISIDAVGGIPRFEVPSGVVDGSNRVFRTSVPYVPTTTAILLNGQLKRMDWDDGWVETDSDLGLITLNEAPILGDVVQVFFVDTTPAPKIVTVQPLVGRIQEVSGLTGKVNAAGTFVAVVRDSDNVLGRTDDASFRGTLDKIDSLRGRIGVCS